VGSAVEVLTLAPEPRLSGRDLGKLIARFVVPPWDVNDLKTMELVLKLAYFLAKSLHFWVMAARGFHDLIDDQLRVTSKIEASYP